MNDAFLVRRFQRIQNLFRNLQRFICRQRAALQPLRQRFGLHEFHDDASCFAGFFQAVDVSDIRVIQRGENLGFSLKTGETIRIIRESIRKSLDGNVSSELRVVSAEDDAHPSFAKRGSDLIGTDCCSNG